MIDFYGGAVYTCYKPSSVRKVQAGIRRFRPLDPSSIVKTVTGLPLTQILLSQGTSDHRHPHGDGIYYIFSTSSVPLFSSPPSPERKYMVVAEGRARGAPTTITIISGPDHSYLNGGSLPRRSVAFGIESNVDPTLVRQVGAAMEQADDSQ